MEDRELLHLGLDLRKCRDQLVADAVHEGDDGNGNARGDQTIFDGGRTGLVLHEMGNQVRHLVAP